MDTYLYSSNVTLTCDVSDSMKMRTPLESDLYENVTFVRMSLQFE